MAKELACEIHEADDEDKHYISPDRFCIILGYVYMYI